MQIFKSKAIPNFIGQGVAAFAIVILGLFFARCSGDDISPIRFEVSFAKTMHDQPITGRLYVLFFKNQNRNPRFLRAFGHQPVSEGTGEPFFGVDVHQLNPGEKCIVDESAIGYPVAKMKDLPAGDYYVQAVLNIYTQFQRSDGHVIWAHLDQWEGQQAGRAPGNLISDVVPFRFDPSGINRMQLELNEFIPPAETPPDTEWIKRVKIQSRRLSEFWGRPIFTGATLLLPKGYNDDPGVLFPAVYVQGHFSLGPPWGFCTDPSEKSSGLIQELKHRGIESGYEFYKSWNSEDFPRMLLITFQHPTPYFDDSYGVNSANNGPYADALLEELIPHLEKEFRIIPESHARLLTGGSTGGYISLALQVHFPKFFGGSWVFYPDPIDFRHFFLVDIYKDDNAFMAPGFRWLKPERFAFRSAEGQPIQSIRQLSQLALALGSRGRSCEYLEAWEASFGPVNQEGYPKPLFDKKTGKIDKEVAQYWKDQGYDLVHYLEKRWPEIGPDLVGKIHVYVGDMDNYYFNLPVYELERFLENTQNPYYAGSIHYGRPLKEHGWQPMNRAELLRIMAAHISKNAPRKSQTETRRPK